MNATRTNRKKEKKEANKYHKNKRTNFEFMKGRI